MQQCLFCDILNRDQYAHVFCRCKAFEVERTELFSAFGCSVCPTLETMLQIHAEHKAFPLLCTLCSQIDKQAEAFWTKQRSICFHDHGWSCHLCHLRVTCCHALAYHMSGRGCVLLTASSCHVLLTVRLGCHQWHSRVPGAFPSLQALVCPYFDGVDCDSCLWSGSTGPRLRVYLLVECPFWSLWLCPQLTATLVAICIDIDIDGRVVG